jgi:glycosyltransferase involved in cell wall biosynthesis
MAVLSSMNSVALSERTLAVSIIIPARNEEKVIGACLQSIQQLDFDHNAFEVIVVDNGSTDKTIVIVQRFQTALNLAVMKHADVHISAARNLGAAHAKGQFLAFLDADCLAPRKWLLDGIQRLNGCNDLVVGAYYRIPDGSSWLARAWYEPRLAREGSVPYLPGGSLWITREAFFRVGGFDESIETNEDCEFCTRAKSAGMRILAFSELAVIHLGTPQALGQFFRKQRWHGTAVLTVFLRNIRKFSNGKVVSFGLYTLFCIAGICVGAVKMLLGEGFHICVLFLLALLFPSIIMSFLRVQGERKWQDFVALVILNLTFGVARASCLVDLRTWRACKITPQPGKHR